MNDKFKLIDKNTLSVLDIGCAPGSWLQYTSTKVKNPNAKIIGFDIKKMEITIPRVYTYQQDITDHEAVRKILENHKITKLDFIQSDMAPNTI
ncbi:methyltransferase domain-containing protein [Patescibacteria group bacterium]|nr:methyltransferase domain-containing protein [Patescibacteria group bacterium]MBU1759045.1 methyltransferase domain-containing protein [Patescibacteria group bacterium]